MKIQITQETYNLLYNIVDYPAFRRIDGFLNHLLNYLEESMRIPELLETGNTRTPEHKLMFIFFNSDIINENDRRVHSSSFN